MNDQRQFDILDLISVLSFLLGYENLMENRDQSRHNDIDKANGQQAKYLLEEIERKFDQQNEMLKEILKELKLYDR